MADYIREYLIGIGFATDNAGLRKFQDALKNLSAYVERHTTHPIFGIGAMFAKVGIMAASALTAIDASIVGLMAHTARSDLDMQLFARRMFMSTEAARSMKMATDALGVSLEDVIWGPPELRERYRQLIEDQRRMGMGQNWEAQMRMIRDVQFQFTRMWVEVQRFAMMLAGSLSKALFGDEGSLERNLKQLNEKFISRMPELADELAKNVVPVLRTSWDILKGMAEAAKDLWNTFLMFKNNWNDFKTIFGYGVGGAAVGGTMGGPVGAVVGGATGAGLGWLKQWAAVKAPVKAELQRFARMAAQTYGLDPQLFEGLVEWESAHTWNPMVESKAGAYGLTQFMPETGRRYLAPRAASPDDIDAAIRQLYAGARYLSDILKYPNVKGDIDKALAIYSGGAKDYAAHVKGEATFQPQSFNPQITIHVQHLNATKDDLKDAVSEGLKQAQAARNKRLAIQFSEGYATNFVG